MSPLAPSSPTDPDESDTLRIIEEGLQAELLRLTEENAALEAAIQGRLEHLRSADENTERLLQERLSLNAQLTAAQEHVQELENQFLSLIGAIGGIWKIKFDENTELLANTNGGSPAHEEADEDHPGPSK